MEAGACWPWTLAPATSMSTSGFLRASVRLTSSMTDPESDVTTQTREQKAGMGRLRRSSMSPSTWSLRASSAMRWRSSPSPDASTRLATKDMRPEPL